MAKKPETKVEVGIPGVGKVTHSFASSSTIYRYFCEARFDSEDDARQFRTLVEEGISRMKGKIVQSSLGTVE